MTNIKRILLPRMLITYFISFHPYTCDAAPQFVLEQTKSNMRCEVYKSDEKRPFIKKETEPDHLFTSKSDNPVIQQVQRKKRTIAGVVHLSSKNLMKIKIELSMASEEPTFDLFGINRKKKMMDAYMKARYNATCTATSTTTSVAKWSKSGSLSDRLQLIDTTPTGEDPYQLGEADLSEPPPIPKLILRKTKDGSMKVLDQPSRRIYDPASPEPKTTKHIIRCFCNNFASDLEKEAKRIMNQKFDLGLLKTEPEIDWRIYPSKTFRDTQSIVEYSLSDGCRNPASYLTLDCNEFQDLFMSDSALNLEELNIATTCSLNQEKISNEWSTMSAKLEAIVSKL